MNMKNSVFIELPILSTKTTAEEQLAFQNALIKYEEEMQEWRENEDLSRLRGVEKPSFPSTPGTDPAYCSTFINVGEPFYIESWAEEYDEKNECSMIIVYYNSGAETKIMNVRKTKEEWIEILESLGAKCIHNKTIL